MLLLAILNRDEVVVMMEESLRQVRLHYSKDSFYLNASFYSLPLGGMKKNWVNLHVLAELLITNCFSLK
jgi:hypothetical protein